MIANTRKELISKRCYIEDQLSHHKKIVKLLEQDIAQINIEISKFDLDLHANTLYNITT